MLFLNYIKAPLILLEIVFWMDFSVPLQNQKWFGLSCRALLHMFLSPACDWVVEVSRPPSSTCFPRIWILRTQSPQTYSHTQSVFVFYHVNELKHFKYSRKKLCLISFFHLKAFKVGVILICDISLMRQCVVYFIAPKRNYCPVQSTTMARHYGDKIKEKPLLRLYAVST